MRISKVLLSACIFFTSCSCNNKFILKTIDADAMEFKKVRLEDILAKPDQYIQKNVEVEGYVAYGFELSTLFLDKEAANKSRFEQAIWVVPDSSTTKEQNKIIEENCNHKRVKIKGVVVLDKYGYLGAHKEKIRVKYIEAL